jgi:hypothetical protein
MGGHLLSKLLCIFSSLTCLKKKPVLSKRDLLRWKVPARLYKDLLTSLSLFLKSEKIPAPLYVGKGPESVQGPFMIFDLFARPIGLGQRSQIVKGLVLRPFSYT